MDEVRSTLYALCLVLIFVVRQVFIDVTALVDAHLASKPPTNGTSRPLLVESMLIFGNRQRRDVLPAATNGAEGIGRFGCRWFRA